MSEQVLARARAGDEAAFRELTEPYRRELQVHCYRILGSVQDAEDLLQETLLAAWRGLDRFEERASLRVWLYRIATNRCLNALRARARRRRCPDGRAARAHPPREPSGWSRTPTCCWTACPTTSSGPRRATRRARRSRSPSSPRCSACRRSSGRARAARRARVPRRRGGRHPRHREGAVRGALQRARAVLDRLGGAPPGAGVRRARRVPARSSAASRTRSRAATSRAWWRCSTDDAWLTMPPGRTSTRAMRPSPGSSTTGERARGAALRLVPTRANGQPAFGCYVPDPHAGSRTRTG